MSDLHDDYERAFVRRVTQPNPMLLELARQAVDALQGRTVAPEDARSGRTIQLAPDHLDFLAVADVCAEFGVPIAYVLDERERRAREAQS